MTFISYAQNYEDVMLFRALKHIEKGFYIDVGANDPEIDSVTKAFYDRGWRGVNIEPVAEWFDKLMSQRTEDKNHRVAVGEICGEIPFYEVVGTGLSTMDKGTAERHARDHGFEIKTYGVPTATLTSICDENVISDIHFLKIDVEGAEKDVLSGFDLVRYRPWIILIEATLPNSQQTDFDQWECLLTTNGYHFVYFDGLNRYYVSDEHSDLDQAFEAPPNWFDHFSHIKEVRLEGQNRALEEEAKSAMSRSEAFEQKLETITGANQTLESNLVSTQERLADETQRADRLSSSLHATEAERDKLKAAEQDALNRINELESELQHVGERLAEEKAGAENLSTMLHTSEARCVELEVSEQNTLHRLKDVDSSRQAAEKDVQRCEEKIKDLEAKRQELLVSLMEKETVLQGFVSALHEEKTLSDDLQLLLSESEANSEITESTQEIILRQLNNLESQLGEMGYQLVTRYEQLIDYDSKQENLLALLADKESEIQSVANHYIDEQQINNDLRMSLSAVEMERRADLHKIEEVETRCESLSKQLLALQNDRYSTDEKIAEQETKRQELLYMLMKKETELQGMQSSLSEKKLLCDDLKFAIENCEKAQNNMTEILKFTEEKLTETKEQLVSVEKVAHEREILLRENDEALRNLHNEFQKSAVRIEELEETVDACSKIISSQTKKLDKNQDKLNQLSQSNHHWWSESDRLTKELEAVYGSTSWRITFPVRKIKLVLFSLIDFLGRIIWWLIRSPKMVARCALLKAVSLALSRPRLKRWCLKKLRKFPNITGKLQLLARANGLNVETGHVEQNMASGTPSFHSLGSVQIMNEIEAVYAGLDHCTNIVYLEVSHEKQI